MTEEEITFGDTMNEYDFIFVLYGKGDTEEEAWINATESFYLGSKKLNETTEPGEIDD